MEHIHEMVNKQFQLWHLIIAFCDYGIDCYWKKREGYFLTLGKGFIHVPSRFMVKFEVKFQLPIRFTYKYEKRVHPYACSHDSKS